MNEELQMPHQPTDIPLDVLDGQGLKNLVEAGMIWLNKSADRERFEWVFCADGDTAQISC